MQNRDAYLERKRAELALMRSHLSDPGPQSSPRGPGDVLRAKLELRARLRAESELLHPELTETNLSADSTQCHDHRTLHYKYQRFDLEVCEEAAEIYPGLAAGPFESRVLFTSSGMGALSSAVLGLQSMLKTPARVLLLQDGYFETQRLLQRFAPKLHIEPYGAERDFAAALAGPRGPCSALIAVVDSISREAAHMLAQWPLGHADLILCDTTCWARDSEALAAVLAAARRPGVPLALARSHVKLDGLGIEYGRLGSLVLACPETDPAHRSLFDALSREARSASSLLGTRGVPAHLPPFRGPEYLQLSARRITCIAHNNAAAAAHLCAALAPQGLRVTPYAHGLFFTIEPPDLSFQAADALARRVADQMAERGLPARYAGTFGLDCIALSAFFDSPRGSNVLRVALSDHSDDVSAALLEELVSLAVRGELRGEVSAAG